MAVAGLAGVARIVTAGVAVMGAAMFAVVAFGQPVRFFAHGAPVEPSWAGLALASALAGLPMAALAYFAAAIIIRPPAGDDALEETAAASLWAGLAGFGAAAFTAGAGLVYAFWAYGVSALHNGATGLVLPMSAFLMGMAVVIAVNLKRTDGAWTTLGHILWGAFGVIALTAGAPMLVEAAMVDDLRILSLRYNLFVVFYPLLWAAYTGIALAAVYVGLRAIRFSLLASPEPQRSVDKPPSTANTWPVTYDASFDIKNRAA